MNGFPSLTVSLPLFCRSLVLIGLGLLLQSALLIIVGLSAARALRRHGPATQRFLYQATLVGVAACLAMTVFPVGGRSALVNLSLPAAQALPTSESEVDVSHAHSTPSVQSAASGGDPATSPHAASPNGTSDGVARVDVLPAPMAPGVAPTEAFPASDHRPFLPETIAPQTSRAGRFYVGIAAIWALGVLAQGVWLLVCTLGIHRICRRSAPVSDSDAIALLTSLCAARKVRPPQLRTSSEVESVYLTGLWRPIILLPASYTDDFDPPTLRAVLAHEVAHLAQRDAWWAWVSRLLCAVCWGQPLLWHLCRQREQASEEVCDLFALTQDCSPRRYAECLIALAERLTQARSSRLPVQGVVTFRSSLGLRVQQILRGPRALAPLSARFRVGVILGLMAIAGTLLFTISPATAQQEKLWEQDARLNQKVAISAEGVPVRELLALLTRKTGILLKTEEYVGDDKIVLFTPARPLRDTLADIAALYNDYWLPGKTESGKPTFLLSRSRDARLYEDGLSEDMHRKMLAQLDAQVRALSETPEELERRPAGDPIRTALSESSGRLATSIFALLNADQRAQLMQNWRTQISVSLLSPAQKQELEPLFFGDRFKPNANDGFVLTQIPREEMDKHAMRFNLLGGNGELSVFMTAPVGFNMEMSKFSAGAKFLLPPHGNPYTGKPVPDSADLPDPQTVRGISGASWVDRLHSFATKTGVPVCADFYRSKPIHAAVGEPALSKIPAFQTLDVFGSPDGYLWWARGKSLLFRKRDWYNQRLYEVPDRWVEAVGRRINGHRDALTYADVLSLSELSIDQIIGVQESLGLHVNRDILAGLPEMLASLGACAFDKNAPLPKGTFSAANALALSVRPNIDAAQQASLISEFLRVFGRDMLQGGDPHEFGYLVLPHGGAQVGTPVGTPVQIDILFATHNSIHAGYILSLPTSIPDDRRANTQITLSL